MRPKEAPRVQVGLNRPRDYSEVIASLTCSQPHSSQNPEREETSRQDVSLSGWEVTCRGKGCHQLSSPGPIHTGKWGDRSNLVKELGLYVTVTPMVERSALGGSQIQEPAGMAPPPCLSGPPHVGPGPGLWGQRTQACLCCVFSLETSPASAPDPPWRAWRLSQGLSGRAVT